MLTGGITFAIGLGFGLGAGLILGIGIGLRIRRTAKEIMRESHAPLFPFREDGRPWDPPEIHVSDDVKGFRFSEGQEEFIRRVKDQLKSEGSR